MAITKDMLKGKTWKQIYDMDGADYQRLDKDTLRIAVQRLSREANKRLESFRIIDETSPATRWAERSGGDFSSKGKTFNQLRAELRRARDFLGAETSTIKGEFSVRKKVTKTLEEKYDIELDEDDYKKVWTAYQIITENDPDFKTKELKYRLLELIEQYVYDRRSTGKSIARKLIRDAETLEKLKMGEDDADGVSGYFKQIE